MSFTVAAGILVILIIILYSIFGGKNDSALLVEDAGRFAKLLISEIKLFENYKFERGLKNNNLYESLRDEIEEAREKYKKRFPKAEFESFFDNVLVEVLADGDKSKLGLISTSLK